MYAFHVVRNHKLWLLAGLVVGPLLLSVLVVTAQRVFTLERFHNTFRVWGN